MINHTKRVAIVPSGLCHGIIALLGCLLLSGVTAGQDLPSSVPALPQLPTAPSVLLKPQFTLAYHKQTGSPRQAGESRPVALHVANPEPVITAAGVRIITLEEAQQRVAATGGNPLVRLGQLQVEVAEETRLGTISTFLPQIGSTFSNFHFNKFMGQQIQFTGPLGNSRSLSAPLTGQNQTLVAVTATQPITPLFQLRELYKINLADERIARAKAGMPVSDTAAKVERAYYELLVAQRQLAFAKVKATETENKWLLASNSGIPVGLVSHDEELIEASNKLAIATTQVKELTAALDDLAGWPADTELQLVPPDPRYEEISLREATAKALATNPEVIEAEQNVVKAQAAATLQKLAYVPVVAAMGGYAYQNSVIPLLPHDFAFVGIVASYNMLDFGKREHTIRGANAQAEMAGIALQLTKAKIAAGVKSSHFELERSRQLSELTRRLSSAIQPQSVSYEGNGAEIAAAKKAKVEAEMFQADLEYRQALDRLKALMGEY
jgi:outer membrane protein TolC